MTIRSSTGMTALVLLLPLAAACGGKDIEKSMTRAEGAAARAEEAARRAESAVTRVEQAMTRAEQAAAHAEGRLAGRLRK
jgi:hypothetical protein